MQNQLLKNAGNSHFPLALIIKPLTWNPLCLFQSQVENVSREKAGKDFFTASKGMTKKEEGRPERRSPFSLCDLQITEPEEQISHPAKDASASFSPTEGRLEAFETHI